MKKIMCRVWSVMVGLLAALASAVGAGEDITLDPGMQVLGGNIRGFGVLAEYPDGGPKRLTLLRQTRDNAANLKPDNYNGWPRLCSLRVFRPDGTMVKFVDLGTQTAKEQTYDVAVPEGPAGVWRFSVANGGNDTYAVTFPFTPTWGVRGEMALRIGKQFPATMYLYIPPTAELLICESFGGATPAFRHQGKPLEGKLTKNRAWKHLVEKPPANEAVAVELKGMANKSLAIDGLPGLLCPTPEAALRLKGGLVEEGGLWFAGPLQARIRKAVSAMKEKDFVFDFPIPGQVPADLEHPRAEAVLFGHYGSLGKFAAAAPLQITDPASPFCGAMAAGEDRAKLLAKPRNFLNNRPGAYFDAAGLASLAVLPARLNPCYRQPSVINRAAAAAFYSLQNLQGDDLLREGDFRNTNYPVTHVFFAYDALAHAFADLKDLLPAPLAGLWRDALTAMGDKHVAFLAYESNQWSHLIHGHLSTYLATGEERFRQYFEIHMNAYLDNVFGPASKHGQHPAGYFLEEFGPDGNYQHLNMFPLTACYYKYRGVAGADPALVEKMRRGIQKELVFNSFYWQRQPDGGLTGPTALNCRTDGNLANPSWPGDYLAAVEFDLGESRAALEQAPAKGLGRASTFGHVANTDEWALQIIQTEMPAKGAFWKETTGFGSVWLVDLYNAFKRPRTAKAAMIPTDVKQGAWRLPGMSAWKRNGLYGLVFHDVEGADPKQELPGITSGGPLALWHERAGTFVIGHRNAKKNAVETLDDVTWAAVAGKLPDGKFFASGKERNTVDYGEASVFASLVPVPEKEVFKETAGAPVPAGARLFETTGTLRNGAGQLVWRYVAEAEGLTVTAKLGDGKLAEPVLVIPLACPKEARLTLAGDGTLLYEVGKGGVKITFPAGTKAELSPVLKCGGGREVRALRLPLSANGEMSVTVTTLP